MVGKRFLSWLAAAAAFALIVVALAFVERARERSKVATPTDVAAVQRTIALFEVRDTRGPAADSTSPLVARLAFRAAASGQLRVVSASILPTVDVAQLGEILNARTTITLSPRGDVVEAAFRRGDTVVARRTFPATSAIADSVILAATVLEPALDDAPGDAGMPRLPDPRLRLERADSLFNRGETVEALREARRAHELDPLSAEIHLAYARLLERAGRDGDAARERDEQRRIATILNPSPKDQIARARFKHVPKRPPRPSRNSRSARTPRR